MEKSINFACEIVKAQAGFRKMTQEEMSSMLKMLNDTLLEIQTKEQKGKTDPLAVIEDDSITCLECNRKFKIITKGHLKAHALTVIEYKNKWGYNSQTPLVCRNLQQIRRENMEDIKLWEKRKL